MSEFYNLPPQLSLAHILQEAQTRWLRPAEICEILRNYKKFAIASEPPHKPKSGSLFLFDRNVLRYFRKDGHSWSKKKDGKTVKEAHEKLKSGSVDVLHCYYAHGEENDNFQRRCYWLLEESHSNIVLVHYQEVKGSRTNFNRVKEVVEAVPNTQDNEIVPKSEVETSFSSKFDPYSYQTTPQITETASFVSSQASEYEDAESVYNHPSNVGFHYIGEPQSRVMENTNDGLSGSYYPVPYSNDYQEKRPAIPGMVLLPLVEGDKQVPYSPSLYKPQTHLEYPPWEDDFGTSYAGVDAVPSQQISISNQLDSMTNKCQLFQDSTYPMKEPLVDGLTKEGLKKLDSFDRWVSNELGDVNESDIQHSSESCWDTIDTEDGVSDCNIPLKDHLDTYTLSPSLSQEQLFSIIDFSPNWAYAGSEIKVLVTGKFLRTSQDVAKFNWSCMFGQVEVPAEVISEGVLRCFTPMHKPGRVPFYITHSNRLACSEVREFDYQVNNNVQDVDIPDIYCGSTDEATLLTRFAKLLCPEYSPPMNSIPNDLVENSHLVGKITSLLQEDDSECPEEEIYADRVKEHLLQRLLKEKLRVWLIRKIAEGGKGASILDEEGQGVLHFAALLGYDWAILPTLVAGVNVNFRDVNGWTALHLAAFCGRERTVAFLISIGASPGVLTDPTPLYPNGRTPADLASAKGQKGIAGFLAESSLSDHLSTLQVKDAKASERDGEESTRIDSLQRVTERTDTPGNGGGFSHGSSLKDSLAAVCNATQAAARIHQVFRVQSFQRKQLKEYGDFKHQMSDEHALSLVTVKSRLGPHNEPVQTAAIRIQNKFRSWKGRKEYLTVRQQIVKIQALVRGHQVRKNYKKIIWSVGILDKVILRWRRKGSGLRGFKHESIAQSSSQLEDTSSRDDDYDFLKEGRKQTEERLQKALSRVKSMVQYPEARDQYRRLLNVVTEMKESKDLYDEIVNKTDEAADFDDLIDIDALLDDTYMPSAS